MQHVVSSLYSCLLILQYNSKGDVIAYVGVTRSLFFQQFFFFFWGGGVYVSGCGVVLELPVELPAGPSYRSGYRSVTVKILMRVNKVYSGFG